MKRRRFKHLTWNDRLKIEAFIKCGKSVQEIADEIGVHRNTIYNEIKRGRYNHRNSDWTEEERYSPEIAHAAYRENLAAKGPDLKIGKDYRLAEYIERRIVEDGFSPAAVLGEIKVKGIQFGTTICETTLYSYIKKGVFLTLEMVHLPSKGKQKRSYKRIRKSKSAKRKSAGNSIEKRSPEVKERKTVGHWEMDCVDGKKRTKGALLVLSERKALPPWIAWNAVSGPCSAKYFRQLLLIMEASLRTWKGWNGPVFARDRSGLRSSIVTRILPMSVGRTRI